MTMITRIYQINGQRKERTTLQFRHKCQEASRFLLSSESIKPVNGFKDSSSQGIPDVRFNHLISCGMISPFELERPAATRAGEKIEEEHEETGRNLAIMIRVG